MSFFRMAMLAGAAAAIMAPAFSYAAGFVGVDDGTTFSYTAWASDNADQVSINGGDYLGGASGTAPLDSQFTFSFTGGGIDSTTPQADYFVNSDGLVVARFIWTTSDSADTGTFDDFIAEGVANVTIPQGATVIDIDPTSGVAGFSFAGMAGSITVDAAAAPAPEPVSLALLGVGLAGLGVARRRRVI